MQCRLYSQVQPLGEHSNATKVHTYCTVSCDRKSQRKVRNLSRLITNILSKLKLNYILELSKSSNSLIKTKLLLTVKYVNKPITAYGIWRRCASSGMTASTFRIDNKQIKGLFLQPTLMHNSITTCMSHYYPRHVSGLDLPIIRRNNCKNTASGILALTSGCTVHRLRADCSSRLSTGVLYSRL